MLTERMSATSYSDFSAGPDFSGTRRSLRKNGPIFSEKLLPAFPARRPDNLHSHCCSIELVCSSCRTKDSELRTDSQRGCRLEESSLCKKEWKRNFPAVPKEILLGQSETRSAGTLFRLTITPEAGSVRWAKIVLAYYAVRFELPTNGHFNVRTDCIYSFLCSPFTTSDLSS